MPFWTDVHLPAEHDLLGRAAADGVLHDCPVKPGDRVSQGQTLAVLSSPEIGLARVDVLKRHSAVVVVGPCWAHDTQRCGCCIDAASHRRL
jgi:predicted deacylase